MDEQNFFKTYSGMESSFLLGDIIHSTEEHYMRVAPRASGTTTSLLYYELYKIFSTSGKYRLEHIVPNSIMLMHMRKWFSINIYNFVQTFNNVNPMIQLKFTNVSNTFKFYISGINIGEIILSSIRSDNHLYNCDEMVFDAAINSNLDIPLYEQMILEQKPKRIVTVNSSFMVNDLKLENRYSQLKYYPFFLFWHIDILEYQIRMLNILDKYTYEDICLMKGKYDGRLRFYG